MNTKLVSLLKYSLIGVLLILADNVYAEYYSVGQCTACVSKTIVSDCHCYARPVYHAKHRSTCHKPKRHKHHYVKHHSRSSYKIEVYYVTYGYPAPCCQSCNSSCTRVSRCCSSRCPSADFVTFSGQPSRYSGYTSCNSNS